VGQAAADTLAARNIFNAEVEAYLRGLLATATKGANTAPVPDIGPEEEAVDYQAKAGEFDKWLTDWRRTLRSAVTRRDYLIQLGLASRRSGAKQVESEEEDDGAEGDSSSEVVSGGREHGRATPDAALNNEAWVDGPVARPSSRSWSVVGQQVN
jgi:hypothetical protein